MTGRIINGTVWLCGRCGRGAGHEGDCEPAPRGTDVCGMAPCEAILKIRARQTRVPQMLKLCFKISQARQGGEGVGTRGQG